MKGFYSLYAKRWLDLIIALSVLLILSIPVILTSILVAVTLGRPIIFRQRRPGLNQAPFTIFKFRTMTHARDTEGNIIPDGKRLTRIGSFLRSMSLDELPELLNVIKGDMSLVGPRPLLMQYLERYTPEQNRRHEVKPGITGWAQVNGRNTITWEEKFALDVWYVDHLCLSLDLKIIAFTIWKIITREGINQPGQATAEEFNPQITQDESVR
jgi:sugar transferase EpsL